jgi:glutaryl-CoA dehydrogenase
MTTDYYLLDDLLTDDARAVRERVRAFVESDLLPVINDYWDRAEFPWPLVPKLAALGVVGGAIEGYGCPGLSPLAAGMVTLEMSRGDGSINTFFGVQSGLAMGSINLLGNDEQRPLENHVARHLTDMEVVHTYEGTDSIQALLVGRDITGISAIA